MATFEKMRPSLSNGWNMKKGSKKPPAGFLPRATKMKPGEYHYPRDENIQQLPSCVNPDKKAARRRSSSSGH